MAANPSSAAGSGLLHATQAWLAGWWQVVHLGALMLVLALSAASHCGSRWPAMATQLVRVCLPMLPGFTVVTALISLVIIRIVTVTALSYGLSQYALEMLVRVLVLELIPLAAALYASLRATLPMAGELAALRQQGGFEALLSQGRQPLIDLVLPRVLAGMLTVMLLAALSGVLTLLLAYLSVHGFTLGGFEGFSRTVGRVFSPVVSLIFSLKVVLLGAAVTLIPLSAAMHTGLKRGAWASAELQSMLRMVIVMLGIEIASLVGNYY